MFPSGVTAVCALIDDVPVGIAASSFVSVSIEPPLVSVCVAKTSTTWPVLRRAKQLGISVLSAEHGFVARALSSKTGNRFDCVSWESTTAGAVLVHGSALWLECNIQQEVDAGDHVIVVLTITSITSYPDIAPMVFHSSKFRKLEA